MSDFETFLYKRKRSRYEKNKVKNAPNFECGNAAKVAGENSQNCKQIQASHCENGLEWD